MLVIDLDSAVPLGDQVVRGLRALIARGRLAPGDELPPVRQLASDLGINLNTVARAYRELEKDGLLASQRGRGTRVTATRETPRPTAKRAAGGLREGLRGVLADAKLAGIDRRQARGIVDELVKAYWPH